MKDLTIIIVFAAFGAGFFLSSYTDYRFVVVEDSKDAEKAKEDLKKCIGESDHKSSVLRQIQYQLKGIKL